MSMIATGNPDVQMTLNEFNKNVMQASKSLSKISTGQKIVGAQDGTADYAISEKMREQIRSLGQDTQNVQNGSTIVRIAERGVDQIIQEIRSLKELAINAANDSNTDADRRVIQKEFNSRKDTINDIVYDTQYNGKILLDGRWEEPQIKVDLIFLVDTTGSMSSSITNVKNTVGDFANQLTGMGYSLNLGLVLYDDVNPSESSPLGVKSIKFGSEKFTKNVSDFTAALGRIAVNGGGDFPESGLEGVMEALDYTFRDNSKKGIIVISDATVHKKDKKETNEKGTSEYTLNDVLTALRKSDVKLSAVTSVRGKVDWGVLADGTDGNIYDINGDYGAQLTQEADSYGTVRYNPIHIHHGTQSNERIHCYINSLSTKDLGLDDVEVTTRDKALDALSAVDRSLERALYTATSLGAYLQRLDASYLNITTSSENIQAAESTIRDADMAKEMTEFARNQMLSRSSQAMFSQANRNEQSVLGLLQ